MNAFAYLPDGMSEFDGIISSIKKQSGLIHTLGLSGSQKSQMIYSFGSHIAGQCLVICADEKQAGRVAKELSFFCSDAVLYFPPHEYVFYDVDASDRKSEYERIKSLSAVKSAKFIVASVEAVSACTVPVNLFYENTLNIKVSDSIDMTEFIEKLVFMGYSRVSTVERPGQFSLRGSIIDIFAPCSDFPYRIELWGDDVDSIRLFDPQTQLSDKNADTVVICPAKELIYTKRQAENVIKKIRDMKNENLLRDIEKFTQNHYFHSADKYMPFFYDKLPTLFDYMAKDTLIIADEPKEIKAKSDISSKEQGEVIAALSDKGLFPRCKKPYALEYCDIAAALSSYTAISISALSHSVPEMTPVQIVSFSSKTLQSYTSSIEYMLDDIVFWHKKLYRIIVILSSDAKIVNLKDLLFEKGIVASIVEFGEKLPDFGEIYIMKGSLERGFEYPDIKTVVVTDGEQTVKKHRKIKATDSKDIIKSFEELSVGDYVVHRTHGIARYAGISQLEVQGVIKDYIKLNYKGTDCLYVPVNQLNLLYKYSASSEKSVKLNSLGGTQWQKTVSKVKESVSKLAEDMIKLYAERSRVQGHVFPKDTEWQKQFEDDFMYDETEDQIRCINEVKSDMEHGKCMDRLLCGDVGYGKTEVALRAAFKCVMDGMQVAYLVPTTILAQQHYNTFVSRMKDYCINVEMLSRFRTKKQQTKITEKLKNGEIDVIIGTHRILQKDVKFKSLGMLIIDEEQRFGVGHKEALKEIKKNVGVLTLSATPIPRTLNMAMIGIRDLSVIASPPSDRYPVQTFVMEYNTAVVQNAVQREISRGGQVYYLFNRVEGIERAANELQKLVPEARIAVAHGKMSEAQLESIMLDLLDGSIDVLVCTTIIETGLDVPNANTIIIENSDCLGLSQLYQLKGRVGRSNRLSYAYFTYREGKVLDQVAQKRLQAIREFTEFGAGFKIALRDLEIRGAGNLLGKEQHGNMNLVGYDMYCLLLERAVKELKGTDETPKPETTVDIKISAYIPEKSISDEQQRIDMYRQIAAIESDEDVLKVQSEFIDRYGDIPKSTENLIELASIKALASELYISDILQKDDLIIFTIDKVVSTKAIVEIMDEYRRKMMFSSGETSYLSYKYDKDILHNIKIILQKLTKAIQDEDCSL